MRQTTKARHTLGIRGQLMWFLCFICLFLLGLFWLLSTQLLEPLYTKHIETQLTNQADSIVERLDDAIAEGKVLSSWSFGQLAVNSDFFDKLTLELYTKGSLNSFCVDISDTTLHTIYKIENQSFCNLHGTYLSDSANNDKIIATALAMRRKCRSVGSFVQTLNPPRLSGSAQLLVGRITADGSYTVLVTTSLVHVTEAGKVLSTLLPLAAALIFGFAILQFPATIFAFFPTSGINVWWQGFQSGIWYQIVLAVLIIAFTYFYTSITFNPVDISKNMQQNGGIIPGIRQGRATSDYLSRVSGRLTLFSALFLAVLATIPTMLTRIFGISAPFGASSVLIAVSVGITGSSRLQSGNTGSVGIETIRQVEAQMVMRHHKGFLG